MRTPFQTGGGPEEVGADEGAGRAAFRLPPERTGPVRVGGHSILQVEALRYSITFRNLIES